MKIIKVLINLHSIHTCPILGHSKIVHFHLNVLFIYLLNFLLQIFTLISVEFALN